ncbi:uncharacterized protein APUU_11702A [Aspergillus puulaauensis]|uniref:Uncharacterized protein n=1 Tax=Aspergillus puulaauensis TaxID=1220207 RepID=A0A7R7XCM5_9EURO|nr:uncharacterized protein APUU_11702A [Aspergillus puulaauensis]BCS18874.1 hypothetical protein APUU_11702A [Aspergillus puulaauensis]
MPKVTVHFKDALAFQGAIDSATKILEGPKGPPPIAIASTPPVYISGRDLTESEVGELKSLPGVDAVPHHG